MGDGMQPLVRQGEFEVCKLCGAQVADMPLHKRWHQYGEPATPETAEVMRQLVNDAEDYLAQLASGLADDNNLRQGLAMARVHLGRMS